MKKRYKILLGISCFFTVNLACKLLNGDFDLANLIPPKSSIEGHPEIDPSLKKILDQPFRYLAHGHQTYVFASEDGKHVLKLFQPHYPALLLFDTKFHFTVLPLAKSLYNHFGKAIQKKQIEHDFQSYINAFYKFKKESLVEHLHLEKTENLNTKIHFFDKIGVKHTIDADNSCFLIQKRAPLINDVLKTLSKEEAKTLFYNLLSLIQKREELGFYKPTHKLTSNFGCIDLQPIQFDIGRLLTKKELGLEDEEEASHMGRSLLKVNMWLKKTDPSLLETLEEVRVAMALPEADTSL